MFDFFKKVFEPYRLTDEQVKGFLQDFTGMLLLALTGASQDVLMPEDRKEMNKLWQDKKWDEVWWFLQRKHGPNGWHELLKAHARPILKDYLKSVAGVEVRVS